MHLGWHLAVGVIIGATVKEGWGPIIMGSVGIDLIDHGIWGLLKIRPLKIKNLWNTGFDLYHRMEAQLYFFHTFEMYLIMSVLSNRFSWGRLFMLAYSVHLLMDMMWYLRKRRKFDWVKKWFFCWWFYKRHLTQIEVVYKRE